MSRGQKDNQDTSSVDAILKSLSSRPNVQCTLILSRKDGSIIKASGFREPQTTSVSTTQNYKDGPDGASSVDENNPRPSTSKSAEMTVEGSTTAPSSTVPAPAEILANSIYTFIRTADGLASTMASCSSASEGYTTTKPTHTGGERNAEINDFNTDESNVDLDIQLLRMRTRRQEIIIFPDDNYLCCVVQNIGKTSGSEFAR